MLLLIQNICTPMRADKVMPTKRLKSNKERRFIYANINNPFHFFGKTEKILPLRPLKGKNGDVCKIFLG